MEYITLAIAGISLLWQLGSYVSTKTKNKVDDAVFQHPEVEEKIKELVSLLLSRKIK